MVEHRRWLTILTHAILIVGVLIVAFPIYVTFVASTHSLLDVVQSPMPLLPGDQLIDNYIEAEGDRYDYRNSSEVTFYQDNRGQGKGFYHWDFMREDGDRVLSVSKWEGRPFEAVFSEVIAPDSIKLYKGERTEPGSRR